MTSVNINKQKDELLFIPLGGAGEIGMNFNLYHHKGKWIIVDCGAGFAEEYMPGIDMIVPDISFILKHKKNIEAIILTHSHEDHFGAVQYLWDLLECPIYATKFTKSFLKRRLKDNGISESNRIIEVKQNSQISLGPFGIDFVPLCHSAPEMQALVIRTEFGNIFHTGDWKFDEDPILGEVNDEKLLRQYGEEGVLALVGDSTNIFREEFSGSEGKLRESLFKIINSCPGIVVVATFASNVARLEVLLSIAKKLNKKVVLSGMSLVRVYASARECNYLTDYSDVIIDDKSISSYKRDSIMVIATGCQGEPLASVTKIANKIHKIISLSKGDTVIFSSKIIPGNEKKIFRVFNKLVFNKVEVITEKDDFVHVSGHPSKKELSKLYKLLNPKILIPVHGELMHMHAHAKFGKLLGIEKVIEVQNGDIVRLSGDPSKLDSMGVRQIGVYGKRLLDNKSKVLKMRRRVQTDGVLVVNLVLSKKNMLLGSPLIFAPGYLDENEDKDLIQFLIQEVVHLLKSGIHNSRKKTAVENIENHIKSVIKSILKHEIGKVPEIKIITQIV
ncbi:MAG: ribonuclease J [Rickettsiales bacterium]